MLVIAGAAALALRGAGWWARFYAWASLLILLVAVAAGDAFHATHVVLPIQPTRAVAAVIPWAFLLVAFGLLLEMLRHFRRTRTSNGQPGHAAAVSAAAGAGAAANGTGSAGVGNGDPGSPAQRAAVTWAAAGTAAAGGALPQPRTGLDLLLGPREGIRRRCPRPGRTTARRPRSTPVRRGTTTPATTRTRWPTARRRATSTRTVTAITATTPGRATVRTTKVTPSQGTRAKRTTPDRTTQAP